ncbi:MAG TPA: hypothetical protein VMY87_03085 [Armatimonadota bacterium]|nr:hypothetical protein [Armatimonadota bacterium]
MQDIVARIKEAAAAVEDLPSDLRPVAFRYVLEQLRSGDNAEHDAQANGGRRGSATAKGTRKSGRGRGSRVHVKLNVTGLRQFVGMKKPKNHEQRAAAIAAYFFQDGVKQIGGEHIRRAYAALRCKRPRNIAQILCNAHCRKDWFTAAGPDGLRELTDIGKDFLENM